MATKAQKIRLGVFMLLAFLLLVGTVGTLAGIQMWNPRDIYFVSYKESVSGLDIGSAVKMKGVRVGRVETIKVAPDTESVRVELALDPGTPITVDTKAVVMSIGITGLKFIELTGGHKGSTKLEPNTKKSEITAGESVLQTLTGKATDIATKMEGVLNNVLRVTDGPNRKRIALLLENGAALAKSLKRMSDNYGDIAVQNKKRLRKVVANLERGSANLERATKAMHKLVTDLRPPIKNALTAAVNASNSISRIAQNVRPQRTLNEFTRAARALRKRIESPGIDKTLSALQKSAANVGNMTRDVSHLVSRSSRRVTRILSLIAATARNFRAFSRSIRERPSLLLGGKTLKEREVK
jgi:phospholipid/cholesterol/gamma-HCH transport system substrate-binding protein